jgi:hypothetical protein
VRELSLQSSPVKLITLLHVFLDSISPLKSAQDESPDATLVLSWLGAKYVPRIIHNIYNFIIHQPSDRTTTARSSEPAMRGRTKWKKKTSGKKQQQFQFLSARLLRWVWGGKIHLV